MYEQHISRLRLAVCDDEPAFCDQIVEWTREILQQERIEADIERFESARPLLDTIEAGATFSILLLDVMMDGCGGMRSPQRATLPSRLTGRSCARRCCIAAIRLEQAGRCSCQLPTGIAA